jgi:hypothetical protein
MTRTVTAEVLAALQARVLQARDFVWIFARDYESGDPVSAGWWNGLDNVTASYEDIDTGQILSRTYGKAGALLSVDSIPLTSDLTARNFEIRLSQIDQAVADLVRGYDLKGQRVEVHRGLFHPGTNQLVAALFPRALGFCDNVDILDPAEGNDGQITLSVVSHTLELTRTNAEVRSDASQQNRVEGDGFYKYTAVAGGWENWWGVVKGKIETPEQAARNRVDAALGRKAR